MDSLGIIEHAIKQLRYDERDRYGYPQDGKGYGAGHGLADGSGEGDGHDVGAGFNDGSGGDVVFGYQEINAEYYGSGEGLGGGYENVSGEGYGEVSYEHWQLDNKHCLVHKIDNILTALYSAKYVDDILLCKGLIFNGTNLEPIYVAMQNSQVAHGTTAQEAINKLQLL